MSGTSGALAPVPNQTISFSEIPYNLQVPGTYMEVHANYSQAGLLNYPAKALIIGQMAGPATPNVPYPVYSETQGYGLFGAKSIVGQMIAAFIAANPWTDLDVIGVGDAYGATPAVALISFTGTATQAGTLAIYLQGIRIAVPVNAGDAAAVVNGNFQGAFNEVATGLTINDGAPTPSSTNFACANLGTLGNSIDFRLNAQPGDMTPPGIVVTITPFAGGATDPTIATALNAIAASWYTDIVMCWNDPTNVGLLEAALATRYAAMGKLDAQAYRAIAGTPAQLQAAQTGLNSRYTSVIGMQNPLAPTWAIAASFAGVCSYNLANDPSRQLRDLALPGIVAPAQGDRFTETERNILLGAGISTFNVQVDGTVTLERVVNEYLVSPQGVPDSAWHDIMVPKTMSRIRYDWIGYVSLTYPRNNLADDGTLAAEFDSTVVTPSRLQGSWAGRSRIYAELGWIEHSTALAKQAVFVRDQTDPNRVNARQQVQIIGNLMILAGSLEFAS